ncbi:hypothetical protein F4806DRAFT_465133 [Annulohypoxylon nitens]|nr:hypothetical protein F4806DRAFT_465133 [Annulohypoxylon nitens]
MTSKSLVHRVSLSSRSTPSKKHRHESPGSESPPAGESLRTKEVRCSPCQKLFTWLGSTTPEPCDVESPFQPPNSESSYTDCIGQDLTSDSTYRTRQLNLDGINILSNINENVIDDRMPQWVQDILNDIMKQDDTDPTRSPTDSSLKDSHSMLFRHRRDLCYSVEEVKSRQVGIIAPLDPSTENTTSCPSLPFVQTTRTGSFNHIAKPYPGKTFGYDWDSFPTSLRTRLNPYQYLINIYTMMFPYLFVEFQPMSGSIWQAENRCAGDSAVSMKFYETIVGYEQVVFSVAMNDQLAVVFIMWSSEAPLRPEDEVNVTRYYYMYRLRSFLLTRLEEFATFWRTLDSIHKWADTTRFQQLKKILEGKDEESMPRWD